MNVYEFLSQLDNLRRGVGRNAMMAVTSPREAVGNALSRYAQENIPTQGDFEDAQSVMPGMGNALQQKIYGMATNAMGGGIMAGKMAKTADLEALEKAQGMAKNGLPREDIWKQTGWYLGPEGKWKFEIPDRVARMRGPVFGYDYSRPATQVMSHDDLFGAYPSMAYTPTVVKDSQMTSGSFGSMGITLSARIPSEIRSAMLHELQHGVQEKEGFARGGNTMTARGEVAKPLPKHYDAVQQAIGLQEVARDNGVSMADAIASFRPTPLAAKIAQTIPYPSLSGLLENMRGIRGLSDKDAYKRLAGEAEARAVQKRADMSLDERRNTPPWESYDTKWSDLFVVR